MVNTNRYAKLLGFGTDIPQVERQPTKEMKRIDPLWQPGATVKIAHPSWPGDGFKTVTIIRRDGWDAYADLEGTEIRIDMWHMDWE